MLPKIPDVTIKALRAVLESPTLVDWVNRIADGASVSAGDLDRLLKVAQAQALIAGHETAVLVEQLAVASQVSKIVDSAAGIVEQTAEVER